MKVAEKTKIEARHRALGLSDAQTLEIYWLMLLARRLDERMWILHRQHEVAFHISGIGHEATQVGSAFALKKAHDYFFPYYRDMAMVIAWGVTPRDLLLAMYGKQADPFSGARQMPQHYGSRALNIVTVSSPVASQIPQASGAALAIKYKGTDQVVVTCFGEGSTAEGDFHEGLNWAGIHKLPVIFLCENNQYAISEPQEKEMPVKNVADRAAAYGMPGVIVDGNDALESYRVMRDAVARARRGEGATLIEAKTYRPVPNSSDDDDRTYRSRAEVDEWKKRDPILLMKQYLENSSLLNDAKNQEYETRARQMVDDANEFARNAPYPAPEEALEQVWGKVSQQ
ncbi:MAG: thiamine pyrophosphate-dependent dehydrogenase E1 component subunit alpha [Chloroflexi bacterium]|nr:thiamine pyrophosphate-dependent dehydrogenase E1 component subunit alpha [Chloroflexota bacterium]